MSPHTPIPTEIIGAIRQLRKNADASFEKARKTIVPIVKPLVDVTRSRKPTKWLIERIARQWQEATDDQFRCSWRAPDSERQFWFGEARIQSSHVTRPEWEHASPEPGFVLVGLYLRQLGRRCELGPVPMVSVSLHAACRYQQRTGKPAITGLRDLTYAFVWSDACAEFQSRRIVMPGIMAQTHQATESSTYGRHRLR